MTIQQLEYIVALDDHRNFVKAAESCLVTQPTLTMQVKKLEDEAGVKLFNRNKKPLTPTVAGEQFLLKARQILRDVNDLKQLINDETECIEGTFRIGIIPTLAPYILPLFLYEFVNDHPNTHLQIKEVESEQMIDQLKHNLLDVGILATPIDESQIREIPLFYEPFWVLFPDHHPLLAHKRIKSEWLHTDDLLLLAEGHCFRNQTLNICNLKEGKPRKLDYESGSIETIKNLIKRGAGYSLVPELSILEDLKTNKNLRPLEKPVPTREISIITHNSYSKEAFINLLRKSILKHIPDRFQKNQRFVTVKWR